MRNRDIKKKSSFNSIPRDGDRYNIISNWKKLYAKKPKFSASVPAAAAAIVASFGPTLPVFALPEGLTVKQGNITTQTENNTLTINEAKSLFESLSDRIKNTKSGRAVKQQLEQSPKAEVGKIAPPFEGPNPEGNQFALRSGLGKVTIIDFWASWCRPCRIENPNLVQLYHRNKNRGLSIVGVSLDKDKNKWRSFDAYV